MQSLVVRWIILLTLGAAIASVAIKAFSIAGPAPTPTSNPNSKASLVSDHSTSNAPENKHTIVPESPSTTPVKSLHELVAPGPASGMAPHSSIIQQVLLPAQTIYTDNVPIGFVRTVRSVKTVQKENRLVNIVSITHYRHPKQVLPLCTLEIPSIHVCARIVEGVTQRAMARGPGHFPGMAMPGQIGNCGIAAHLNVPGAAYFRNLHKIRIGAHIYIYTRTNRYVYTVIRKHIVRPTNVTDLAPTLYRRLTLVTCTPPHSLYRLVVIAIGK